MKRLDIAERNVGSAPGVFLSGELNFDTAPELRDTLVEYIKARRPVVVVDLSDLAFMDTSGLATLIESKMKADEYGGRMVIVGLPPLIEQVFEIARVKGLFTIVENEQQAAAVVAQNPA